MAVDDSANPAPMIMAVLDAMAKKNLCGRRNHNRGHHHLEQAVKKDLSLDAVQMGDGKLQADREHQKDDPEVCNILQRFIPLHIEIEDISDNGAGDDIANHSRQIEALQQDIEQRRCGDGDEQY
jgi:hypothetical protein